MLKYVLLLTLISSVSWGRKSLSPSSEKDYFPGKKGCFLLYDLSKNTFTKVINEENCKERVVACSTFKVPLAVMAFDAGILKDENQILKWDGKKGDRPELNQDHNAKTWMLNSVVWFSQRLTPQLGEEKFKKYLKDFHYGNENLSAGITEAWLVRPGSKETALNISPYEQVEFMKNLWNDTLPASKRAMQLTRDITYLETSPQGFKLSGKTGSSGFEKTRKQRLGWFITHIERGQQKYIAVTNFSDLTPKEKQSYGGPEAKALTKEILADQGLW